VGVVMVGGDGTALEGAREGPDLLFARGCLRSIGISRSRKS
jgi:hypothetical protein